jgi:hypothetical protein
MKKILILFSVMCYLVSAKSQISIDTTDYQRAVSYTHLTLPTTPYV